MVAGIEMTRKAGWQAVSKRMSRNAERRSIMQGILILNRTIEGEFLVSSQTVRIRVGIPEIHSAEPVKKGYNATLKSLHHV
jgi:hypothetical protein